MERKTRPATERNVWKLVAIVFIALFAIVLAGGLLQMRLRSHPFMAQFPEPTQEQIELAKGIVAADLTLKGDSIDNYDVLVMNRMVGFLVRRPEDGKRFIGQPVPGPGMMGPANIQVSLRGNSTGYLYIVDMESQKIIMRSFTEWFDEQGRIVSAGG